MFAGGVAEERETAADFLEFVNASPSPFHAVEAASRLLDAAGFQRLSEQSAASWSPPLLQPNGKYYFTRNQSTLLALAVGGQHRLLHNDNGGGDSGGGGGNGEGGGGVSVVAAHTDSPVLRLKPVSASKAHGLLQVNVQTYGGGLWHTWFDRDLSVAGRVFVANAAGDAFESRLVRIDRPLLRIPNLAIHLNRDVNTGGFKPNLETHLVPLLASEVKVALWAKQTKKKTKTKTKEPEQQQEHHHQHHPLLLQVLADQLQVEVEQIRDFELSLYDTQPGCVGGALHEFIFAPRLDNLLMSFCALKALLGAEDTLATDTNLRIVALFDHEEVGSGSAVGAASDLLATALQRLHIDAAGVRRSFLVSADMAHAVHPNYADKHEQQHRPKMHRGVVIKHNANQRYATNAETALVIKEIARRHNIPLQEFVVRNDSGCGSTIGPILAANTGIRTVDVGVAQLAMHSIREMCGTQDVAYAVKLLSHFFADFAALDRCIRVDQV